MTQPERHSIHADDKIEFRNIGMGFGYKDQYVDVIKDVSFKVSAGEFVSVLGPSGCGKSTLMSMAAGFLNPTGGSVYVDNELVTGPDHRRGVVFQQYAVFPWLSVADNIAFGLTLGKTKRPRDEVRELVQRYISIMGLEGFENAFPKTLSGGMLQRVAIARAYAPAPEVLLMDEPFAALDAQTREYMQELLHDTNQQEKRTAMFITHSVEEAIFLSHRIIVLSARPTTVKEVVDVDVPLPRTGESRHDPTFLKLRKHLEQVMRSMSKFAPYGGK